MIICVIGSRDEYWWEGHIESEPHRRGYFPRDYVKSIKKSETSAPCSTLFSILKQKFISFRIPSNNERVIQKKEKEYKEIEERGASLLVDGQFSNRVEALYDPNGHKEYDELSFITGEINAVIGMSVIGIYGVFINCVIGHNNEYWSKGLQIVNGGIMFLLALKDSFYFGKWLVATFMIIIIIISNSQSF